ncbi:MAG TPA: FAD synthetase family protein [Candidatus Limnocylindria bacterium]|nr:FAD synthetase family protein [Candidatus Limnocylindria bacterium]
MDTRQPEGTGVSMSVVHGIDALDSSLGRLFVVVGVFDGLHLGHEYLLRTLGDEAGRRGARAAVITFDHHPDEVLTGSAPPLLCDPEERLERLEAAGVAVTVVQTFDVALRETPFDVFIRQIADRVELAGFLMTPDSAFGYRRAGTPETVAALGKEVGFEVAVALPFTLGGKTVSSSAIRAAIASGDLATAERLLGRPYSVVGTPEQAGATHQTPLAFAMPIALPPAGSYAVLIHAGSAEAPGHATVGATGTLSVHGATRQSPRLRIVFAGAP